MTQRPFWIAGTVVQVPNGVRPTDLTWTCDVCGPQPPVALSGNRWAKRTCVCQRRARKAEIQAMQMEQRDLPASPFVMTPLASLLSLGPKTEPPAELCWTCEVCGDVPPLCLRTGRWIKRSCECQRRQQQEETREQLRQAWQEEQRTRTFGGWMGAQWVDPRVVDEMGRKTFDRFDVLWQSEAFERAMAFARQPKGNLLFYGDYGTGKTHLEAAICNYLREVGRDRPDGKQERMRSLFVSAPQFFMAYEETKRARDQTAHFRLVDQVVSTPLLVFDDIDKSRPTDQRWEIYWLIFDERCKAKRPTVLSTNKRDELEHYIGAASVSRLSRGLVAVEMVGDDYRREEEGES
jgi:DNA replication protein DnaC